MNLVCLRQKKKRKKQSCCPAIYTLICQSDFELHWILPNTISGKMSKDVGDFSRTEERRTLARLCNNRANWDWKTCFFMNTIRTGLFFLRNSLGDKKTCGFDSLDHYMHGNCTCPEPSLTLMICFSTTCLSILDLTSTTHTHTIFCNGRLPDQTVRGPGTLFLH